MAITERHQSFIRELVEEADEMIAARNRWERLTRQYFAEGFNNVTVETSDVAGQPDIEHMVQARITTMITQLETGQTALSDSVVTELLKVASTVTE